MLASDQQLNKLIGLFQQGKRLEYEKNEYIVRPGDAAPPGVFYILEGSVKAYDITKYGEENLLVVRKAGEILGLTWAITGDHRPIIYSTLGPAVLLQISRRQLMDFVRAIPEASLPLLDMVADMYKLHSERIINLEYRTVRERLISFLLTYAKRFGKHTNEGTLISIPLKHQDIASSISATRETTGRELSLLEKKGLLENEQSLILLKDIPGLQSYLG